MNRFLPIVTTSLLLTVAPALFGQATPPPADKEQAGSRARTDTKTMDADATFGRIKELTAGQKVVVDIDNAPDKEFNLADKDVTVKLDSGLKVGDMVKVSEKSDLGKTKSVTISKHTGADPAGRKP